jgi:hypothetical protein
MALVFEAEASAVAAVRNARKPGAKRLSGAAAREARTRRATSVQSHPRSSRATKEGELGRRADSLKAQSKSEKAEMPRLGSATNLFYHKPEIYQ